MCENDGKISRRALAEGQAGAFGEEERGVKESAGAEFAEPGLVDFGDPFHKPKQVVVVRVDAEKIDPVGNCRGEVPVQEMKRAESDEEKRGCFDEFVDGDQHETGGMLVRFSGPDHGVRVTVSRKKS